jgi:hypothetical protein
MKQKLTWEWLVKVEADREGVEGENGGEAGEGERLGAHPHLGVIPKSARHTLEQEVVRQQPAAVLQRHLGVMQAAYVAGPRRPLHSRLHRGLGRRGRLLRLFFISTI